jgi:hypothetical protein
MNFDNYFFIMYFLSGFIIGVATAGLITTVSGTNGSSVIQECEKALPRNQHCILKAIPAEVQL